jgi:hypothetical protein
MTDSDQYSLIPLGESEAPQAKHILQENDLGLLTQYSLAGGLIQAIATYRFSQVISEGRKRAPAGVIDSYCETMGWSKKQYHTKRKVGSVIANNPGIDYKGKSDREILDSAGLLPDSRKNKVTGNQLPVTPPNSAIFKAEIMRLKDENTALQREIEEISAERDQYRDAYEGLQDEIYSLQETIRDYEDQ